MGTPRNKTVSRGKSGMVYLMNLFYSTWERESVESTVFRMRQPLGLGVKGLSIHSEMTACI
jgi:hypothetical protein